MEVWLKPWVGDMDEEPKIGSEIPVKFVGRIKPTQIFN